MEHSTSEQPSVWSLSNGEHIRIDGHDIIIERQTPAQPLQTSVDEVSAVSRGGREMIITRRESDPIIMQLRTLDDARTLEQVLVSRLSIHSNRPRHWDPENPSRAT